MLTTIEAENEVRQRCYQCFRPMSLCFCEAIPCVNNRTDVLILQHTRERTHAFNTARIVRKALGRCQLIADDNRSFSKHRLPIQANAGLLYPSTNAPVLNDLADEKRPSQLVIIDGTWHQAKTIVRDVPQLRNLPCYRLAPASPGNYRIRREPNAQSLSTVEATVAALRALEPGTGGLDQLLSAFHKMVDMQLAHPAGNAAWRQNKKRQKGPRDVPRVLLQDLNQLVIAYGEATPGRPGHRTAKPLPVSWVAERLGTGERFSCVIRQQRPLADAALNYMRLSAADFDDAVSADEFRGRWSRFLRRNDTMIVYHQRTSQLLQHIDAEQPRCLVLKSIFGKRHDGFRSLEELTAAEGLTVSNSVKQSRANQRLGMAVALVERLRIRHSNHLGAS